MINDINMVGYIIGGVVLFFILVGFIADKTGLIKKTFAKEVDDNKKQKAVMPVIPVVEQPVEPIEEQVNEEVQTQDDVITFDNLEDFNSDVSENIDFDNSLVSLENIANVDSESSTDETELDFSNDNTDDFMLSNDDFNQEIVFDDSTDSTSDFMLNDNEDVTNDLTEEGAMSDEMQELAEEVSDSDESLNEEVSNEEDIEEENVESDNLEDVSVSSNLDDIVLPDLEEIDDNEEDVWKF